MHGRLVPRCAIRGLPVALLSLLLGACAALPEAPRDTAALDAPAGDQIVVTVRNGGAPSAQDAGSSGGGYGGLARYRVSPAAYREAAAIGARHGLRQVAAWPIEVLGLHCIVYRVEGGRDVARVLDEVRADSGVESAQSLMQFRPLAGAQPGDPYAPLQDSVAEMQVSQAHRWTRGAGVRVAVVDSGVDAAHPDLAGRIAFARDLAGGGGTAAHPTETHGTAVAGVIAATAGNGVGILGVAPESTLLALRACWQQSPAAGGATICNTLTLAKALALCLSERADVINLSLTGPPDPLLERLLRRALGMGKVVVAAVPAGNDVNEGFPASLPGVLAVASADAPPVTGFGEVLRAPGTNVLTLQPGGRYDFESGSSMAAANVSGTVALLLSLRRSADGAALRDVLRAAPQPVDVASPAVGPVVNACHAVVAWRGAGECEDLRRIHAARR